MSSQFRIWLKRLKLEQYLDAFSKNDIDFDSVHLLTDSDLKELGMSLGHRRRLLAAVKELAQREGGQPIDQHSIDNQITSIGERRQLTVMFCDIVGSTRLAQNIDPEDLRDIILQFQNSVVIAAKRYGGFVAKFLGDGALCYFGWPQAYEDQAERAVRAAIDALQDIQSIDTPKNNKLRVRIGIETGEVVIGDLIGKSSTEETAVVGETPNLASRLQSTAKAGQIVIGPTTKGLLGTTFELNDLGPQRLKGFSERINAWQVVGESYAESRFDAMRGSYSSPLAGRNLELEKLSNYWNSVEKEKGHPVIISGEAGIGKSRLISEFSEVVSGSALQFRFQCSPLHLNNAFFPIKQYLRLNAGIAQVDDSKLKFEKLFKLLSGISGDLNKFIPIYSRLLSIPTSPEFADSIHTPGQFREEVVNRTVELIIETSKSSPALVIVEDTHWSDPSTRGFVNTLSGSVLNNRILLIISNRPEDQSNWDQLNSSVALELEGLGLNESESMVNSVSQDSLNQSVVEQIVKRADGNPLCLEELTKTLLDSDQPKEDRVNELFIPATLQSSLIARLDQLNTAKETAQIGSVIGQSFSFELLQQVSGESHKDILQSMEQLIESGLIHSHENGDDTVYSFKHALVHDAAYSTILRARRKKLHLQIVEVLENSDEDLKKFQINLLAYHSFCGEDWDKALYYNRLAATQSLGQSALNEAIGYFKQAIQALRNLDYSENGIREAIKIRLELRNALWAIGANDELLERLDEAEEFADSIDDDLSLAWISVYRGASLWLIGRNEEARLATEKAVNISSRMDNFSLSATANFYRGCVQVQAGNYADSINSFRQISNALKGDDNYRLFDLPFAPSVVARSWLVWSLAEIGRFDEGIAQGDEGITIASKIEHPFSHAHILYDVGYLHIIRQDFEQAISVLNQTRRLTEYWKLGNLDLFTIGFLGYAKVKSGDTEAGRELLEESLQRYESLGSGLFHTLVLLYLSETYQILGNLAASREFTDQAIKLIEKRGERGHLAYAFLRQGQIVAESNTDQNESQRFINNSLQLAKKHSMKPLQFHCYSELAKISQNLDVSSDAGDFIEQCAIIQSELGVTWSSH